MRFFISQQGVQKGPWTTHEIKQKLESEQISLTDYVYDEDTSDWVLIMNYLPFEKYLMSILEFKQRKNQITATEENMKKREPKENMGSNPEDWFVLRGEDQYGPFSYVEMVKMLQRQQILEFDYIWSQKISTWARVCEVQDFKPERIKKLKNSAGVSDHDIFFRRKHARAAIGATILVHNNREVWKGRSAEVSAGGAGLLIASDQIQVGQELFLHFKAGDSVPPFNAVCKIVSKKEYDQQEYRYGVKFTSISQSVQVAIKNYTDRVA